ncbi:MAG: glycoside hydrolase family 3 N-terminal domain-containing protein [Rickettsiales bacterium]
MKLKASIITVKGYELNEQEKNILKKQHIEKREIHVILFSRNIDYANITDYSNIETKEKLYNLTKEIKEIAPKSLIMIDAEGGTVQRIRPDLVESLYLPNYSFTLFYEKLNNYYKSFNQKSLDILKQDEVFLFFEEKHLDMQGVINSYLEFPIEIRAKKITGLLIKKSYELMSLGIKQYGIDVILAPVADFFDGNAGAIQSRSFGTNPELIAEFCIAAMQGIKAAGLKNCLKHFLCQGQARDHSNKINDGHLVPLSYNGTKKQIMESEGLVFKLIFEQYKEVDYLMIANITLNNFKEPNAIQADPLILSPNVLVSFLKAAKVPQSVTLITDDVFNMPLRENLKNNLDKIALIKEIVKKVSMLKNRKIMILTCCNIEEFYILGGFNTIFNDIDNFENTIINKSFKK